VYSFCPGRENVFLLMKIQKVQGFFVLLFCCPMFFFLKKKRILSMFWVPGKNEVLGKIHAMFGFDS
jgi:hypothetical protein